MSIEYMDSFETQNASRYASGSTLTWGGGGRGSGHVGALSYTGSFIIVAKRNVTSRTTYGQAIAVQTPASPTGSQLGFMSFAEQAGTRHITIMYNAAGKIEVRKGSQSGTLLATSSSVVRVDGAYVHLEAKVTVNSSTGSVDVRANGVAITFDNSLSGINTNNGGAGAIDQLWVGEDVGFARSGCAWDDWIIWNTLGSANNNFLGDLRVGYSAANASGTHSDGTASSGTLLSCVDEVPSNGDTDYIAMDNTSLPKAASFNMENAPANAISINAVQPLGVVRKDDAGTNTGRLLLLSGATEDDGGADLGPVSSYAEFLRIHETDPDTAAAWTVTGFNAIEVGWRRTA